MALIGSILKGTAKLGNQFEEKKRFDYSLQTKVLQKLLDKAKGTDFGRTYNFKEILQSTSPLHEFSSAIPITTYEEFYEKWLTRTLQGEKDVIWPGRMKYFALSSGTSGSPSKRIPVSETFIKNFQLVSLTQMLTLHDYGMENGFLRKIITDNRGEQPVKRYGAIQGR